MSNRAGALTAAACYAAPFAFWLAFTWYQTGPGYHGMDWIAIGIFTLPGSLVLPIFWRQAPNSVAVLVGMIVNGGVIYAVTLYHSRAKEKILKRRAAESVKAGALLPRPDGQGFVD
jgi:hypothetical protein